MADLVQVGVSSAQVVARGVSVSPHLLLEEVTLEGGTMSLGGTTAGITNMDLGEVKVRATLSEPNLNRIVQANLPADLPLKNLQFSLYSGKVKVSGNYVKLVSIPVVVDATILVKNGIDISLDLTEVKAGVGLPAAVVEVIEGQLNRELGRQIGEQMRQLPFPVYVEEIRCEPGRLVAFGRMRVKLSLSPTGETR